MLNHFVIVGTITDTNAEDDPSFVMMVERGADPAVTDALRVSTSCLPGIIDTLCFGNVVGVKGRIATNENGHMILIAEHVTILTF